MGKGDNSSLSQISTVPVTPIVADLNEQIQILYKCTVYCTSINCLSSIDTVILYLSVPALVPYSTSTVNYKFHAPDPSSRSAKHYIGFPVPVP